jgi:long-chain acyl-CoA synthetase
MTPNLQIFGGGPEKNVQTLSSPSKPWLRFYPEGIPATMEYPKVPLQNFLKDSASKHPNKRAISFQGKEISYKELDDLSNRFANGLLSLGVKKGDRVAIILPNIPQFLISFYGALKAGAIVVPCNPLYRQKELEFQLRDSGAVAAVIMNNVYADNNFFSELAKCRVALPNLKAVFVTSLTDFLPPLKRLLAGPVKKIKSVRTENTINFVSFLNSQSSRDPPSVSIDCMNDLAVLQYTGGTTGISKGAMLTHYNLVSNAILSQVWIGLPSTEEDANVLAVIPFFHIYGLTNAMNSSIYAARKIVLLPRFNAEEVLSTIQKEKIAIFPGVSTMYTALLNHPNLGNYSIKSVRCCISGAAPLPQEVQKRFNAITGGNLVEGYGLTEASPVTHCNPLGADSINKVGSIGIPWPDTDAKIVDLETGTKDLPVGETGELAVRGPQVMKGYWNSPEETANVFRSGWLLTGDIAKMDDDGYFYIVDRKKDMIDASGFKVWPREVEEVLYSHPDVKEVAVVGVKDEYRGETVKAFIVLKDKNRNPGMEVFQKFCKERIAPYKVPKIIEFRDELPKSLIGKVLRRKLREEEQAQSPVQKVS